MNGSRQSPDVILALIALLMLACAPGGEGWRCDTLWNRPPLGALPADFEAAERLLGAGLPDPSQPDNADRRMGAKVRTLTLPLGERLAWEVDLGQKPYFSFVPLPAASDACQTHFRVDIVHSGKEQIVHAAVAEPSASSLFGPQTVEIELDTFAGQRVELGVTATLESPGCQVNDASKPAIGSPAVYSHGPFTVPKRPKRPPGPNIVLIGADTLRADHLGSWGHQPSVTPALDRLALESDVWLDAFSTFNVTNPSFASLLTGFYGKNHGVYDLRTPLPGSFDTLAELFSRAGYRTFGVTAATHLSPEQSGLHQGFDGYHVPWGQASAEMAVNQSLDWLQEVDGPFFLWLHLFDAHTPYTPPAPYADGQRPAGFPGLEPIRSWLDFRDPGRLDFRDPVLGGHEQLYRGEVAYLDRHVGRLLDFLASRGLMDDTVIAFTADHGENLGEQGVHYRHAGLWDATVHVPLMVRWPAPADQARGRRLDGLVQTIDLFPTLLRRAGLEVPPSDGEDLTRITGDGRRGRRAVFAEATNGRAHMVRTAEHLYMRRQGEHFLFDSPAFLFDLQTDPEQRDNLAGLRPEIETELGSLLDRWFADRNLDPNERAVPVDLAPEEIERLRALGYVAP